MLYVISILSILLAVGIIINLYISVKKEDEKILKILEATNNIIKETIKILDEEKENIRLRREILDRIDTDKLAKDLADAAREYYK